MKTKICKICKVEKPTDEFYIKCGNADNRDTVCADCRRKQKIEYKRKRRI